MALGSRDIIYFFMGVIAVCLVVSFSAYELTTYESVRDALGCIAVQPSQVVDLHSQYNSMIDQFFNNGGEVFTYHYGSQSIDVTASQARGKSESQVMGMVLDKYAVNFYNGNVPGSLSVVSGIVGASANGFYFVIAVLMFAAFLVILMLSYLQQWYENTMDMLKSAGKIILIMSAVAFIVFLFMPSVVKSVMWSSISTDLGRDVTYVIEPKITGTLLVNTLIAVLFGALLYGAGFLIHINTGEGEPDPMGYVRSAPKLRSTDSLPKLRSDTPGKAQPGKPGRRQL
jgi:hypothetical protein